MLHLWGKKEAHCDAADKAQGLGDCWDHDIIDVASQAMIVRVHGPRMAETVQSAMLELKERLAPGHVPGLVTTDDHSPYVEALLTVFGESHTPFHAPDLPPEGLVQWPKKRLIQRSFQHLGVNARGLG